MTLRRCVFVLLLLSACQGQGSATSNGEPVDPATLPGTNNGTDVPPAVLLPFEPPRAKLRRLSQVEYENTIHDIFGAFVEVPDLEPDTPVNGFTAIGNAQISTSRLGVEKYETAALSIAAQILRNPARAILLRCTPQQAVDVPCTTQFIEEFGPRLFRRPLTATEIQAHWSVAIAAQRTLNDFWQGLEFGLASLLQSPHFLYRTEWGELVEGEKWRKLNGYEIASRLSYLIWASTPDEKLLAAAAEGRLDTTDGVRDEVERMLGDARSGPGLRAFWDEFLQIGGLETKVKDPQMFPEFSPALAADMREETLRVIEHFMDAEMDFREVFSTRTTFLNSRLAALYDVEVSAGPDEFVEVELPDDGPRRGVLGHASFLAGHAHATTTSPTHRGLFVRQSLLCLPIPPPPPNVDTTIEDSAEPGTTLRERLSVHMENGGCAGCHKLMDPIGFGFENFDALGRYRETDNGAPVDASGDLDGRTFTHAGELAVAVAEHEALSSCMVRKLYRHALGHVETDHEEVLIRQLEEEWAAGGHHFRDLLFALVQSDGFRYVQAEEGGE